MSVTISQAQLKRAHQTAIRDFDYCGLCTDKLREVRVLRALSSKGHGWYDKDASIGISHISFARLDEMFGGRRVALTDVVRHELAHALVHLHGDRVDGLCFREVFGGSYVHKWKVPPAFDPDQFVSRYATVSPAEDYAETVKVYTRHSAKVQRYARRTGVMGKFEFVGCLASALERVAD